MRQLIVSLLFLVPIISSAQSLLLDAGQKVIMVGSYPAGGGHLLPGIYVLMNQNPHGCLYGGVLFNDASNMKTALAIALTAKVSSAPVRLDYTKIADGSCIGTAIYIK
jgi:hypothetical protein